MDTGKLIEQLKSGAGLSRAKAAAELGKQKDPAATRALIAALDDSNIGVRNNAIFALAEVGSVEAVPHLIDALEDDEEFVRKSAAKGLGMLKAREAVSELIKLMNDSSAVVRKNAIRSLGKIGGVEAIKALRNASTSTDPEISHLAGKALEHLKN